MTVAHDHTPVPRITRVKVINPHPVTGEVEIYCPTTDRTEVARMASPVLGGEGAGLTTGAETGWEGVCLWPGTGPPIILGFVVPPGGNVPYAEPGAISMATEGGAYIGVQRTGMVELRANEQAEIVMIPIEGIVKAFANGGHIIESPGTRVVINGGAVSGKDLGGVGAKFQLRVGDDTSGHLRVTAGGKGADCRVEVGFGGTTSYEVTIGSEISVRVTKEIKFKTDEDILFEGEDVDARLGALKIRAESIELDAATIKLNAATLISTFAPVVSLGGGVIKLGGEAATHPLLNAGELYTILLSHLSGTHRKPDISGAGRMIVTKAPSILMRWP